MRRSIRASVCAALMTNTLGACTTRYSDGGHTPPAPCRERVFLIGGWDGESVVSPVEVFDVATATWTTGAPPAIARAGHSATLLPGGILVTGGYDGTDSLASTEIYDDTTDAWSGAGAMATPRREHTATLLLDGTVLVAGGIADSANGSGIASAETFDPATLSWSPTGLMTTPRRAATATLLADGSVLVAGGFGENGSDSTTNLTSAERYDPQTRLWSPAGTLTTGRNAHSAIRLVDGRVLVAGGMGPNNATTSSTAEIYAPEANSWTPAAGMNMPRYEFTVTLLENGSLLATGGHVYGAGDQQSSELSDPDPDAWVFTSSALLAKRSSHTATRLADGRVVVAGGADFNQVGPVYTPLTSSEVYDPVTQGWTSAGALSFARAAHTATWIPERVECE